MIWNEAIAQQNSNSDKKKQKKEEEEEGGASREEVRLGHYRQTIRYDTKRMRMKYNFITRKKVK